MNVIQAMSGMRHSEVLGVMHGSLIYDGDILGLRSVLHKFAPEGGSHEDWVVCRYVEKPFQHLRRINQIMTGPTEDAGQCSIVFKYQVVVLGAKLSLWGRSARLSGQRNL